MSARNIGDAELIKQTRDGLVSGFEALVRRYHARCMYFAAGILNNKEDAEEAVQDAFVKVYANIDSFRGDSKFSTWLYKILFNLCYSRLRNKKTFVDISVVEDRYEERLLREQAGDLQNHKFETRDLSDMVAGVLRELPERYKSVMHLFYNEDLTIEEIARIMSISRNSVKVRLYRGRQLLRDTIVKRFGKEVLQ